MLGRCTCSLHHVGDAWFEVVVFVDRSLKVLHLMYLQHAIVKHLWAAQPALLLPPIDFPAGQGRRGILAIVWETVPACTNPPSRAFWIFINV